MRFEPLFYQTYIGVKPLTSLPGTREKGASEMTERQGRATSFGLCQVMGELARELGFTGPFLSQLCDPVIGVHYAALHLGNKLEKYGNLEDALSAYNAGAPTSTNRQNYVQPIIERMRNAA